MKKNHKDNTDLLLVLRQLYDSIYFIWANTGSFDKKEGYEVVMALITKQIVQAKQDHRDPE